ncbi:SDR family oxidoreductase [Sphingobium sp. JS3065]|jgi:NAD(P)-dependent dehydrogenase (short-subunit alcohol dehydrogenase family)|uniref:SDR family NAD(P)-dependent oxidoreductase n=1 Tax=Sphingobium sp. JS3065 TaxID=2970925 RepID=UPI002263DF21|nr:SDR family NAD(P)-dependent oxidoreductase [Sphingobium sp. JS3065]UZW55362.1 SDR family oxidoreductase [Sphingobium sp. JS3065]
MRVHLADRIVLVVGGGSGIGEGIARSFGSVGAKVVVADLNAAAAEQVARDIAANVGTAISVSLDITQAAQAQAGVSAALDAFHQLDIVVNVAGVLTPSPIEEMSAETWRQTFAVNVDGAFHLARAALPALRSSSSAAFINISSLAGGTAYPNGGAYGPSKAALNSLMQQLAVEWAPSGVRVNVVSPGTIDTLAVRQKMPTAVISSRVSSIPLGRLGTVQEIAELVLFLASPAASYITGEVINCDGGLSQTLFTQKSLGSR